ncbi:MAG: 2-methylcitrate synthase [candidate division NC10 bacterium]|nr:2-methylcitrate synthase [candidate division NC10 bacterium]
MNVTISRGLDGVVVDETAVCLADKQTDRLYYRGYPIEELATNASYEEVAYLVVLGELPDAAQLAAYRDSLRRSRALPPALASVLEQVPKDTHPMDVLRTGCSMLGNLEPETKEYGLEAVGARLAACLPSMLFYWHHFHASGKRIETDTGEPDLAGHILHLLHGSAPSDSARRAIEVSLIVYAEHDFNASTFAARVAASTLTDAHSAFVAAICALRGALHGSANAAVLRFLQRFNAPDQAETAVLEMIAQKKRVPGFGQRAYSKADPRNAVNREWARKLATDSASRNLYDVAERVETVLLNERGMFANLDYYTALIYRDCGLPVALFPPMFLLARVCGLVAHIAEQRANNRIIHPSSRYVGPAPRPFVALDSRAAVAPGT